MYPRKKKMAPRRRLRTAPRRGAVRKGARVALPKQISTGNFASATEQYSLAITAGQVYDFTFTLQDLVRTNQLAGLYQYYRITGVELRFKPLYDTFVAQGNSGGTALPYLNFQYDKSGALSNLDANGFEQVGTKAVRMDDKTIVRKWKPSVITTDSGGEPTQFKVSPWLPTHVFGTTDKNDQIAHYGAIWYISKTTSTDSTIYDVDVVINVQYRKPLIVMASAPVAIKPPRVVQGNTSAHQIES